MAEHIKSILDGLKEIAIINLTKGYNDRMSSIIKNNEELNIVLRAKINKNLYN